MNACFKFVREPLSFEDCDGKNAADAYCRERGWTHATTFEVGKVEFLCGRPPSDRQPICPRSHTSVSSLACPLLLSPCV